MDDEVWVFCPKCLNGQPKIWREADIFLIDQEVPNDHEWFVCLEAWKGRRVVDRGSNSSLVKNDTGKQGMSYLSCPVFFLPKNPRKVRHHEPLNPME